MRITGDTAIYLATIVNEPDFGDCQEFSLFVTSIRIPEIVDSSDER
jgi:hypothetical protein